jgi:CP family cyanate transporter-like MFS transporter
MRDTADLPDAPGQTLRNALLLAGILLIAVNLRPAIASVSPVLGTVRTALGLSAYGETALATIPVLCFAALAPLALPLQRRLGVERTTQFLLITLVAGLALRLLGNPPALYLGTALATAALAIGNVLLPAIVKRDFSHRVGLVTGLYVTALNAAAALASAIAVPLANEAGWRGALGFWLIPAIAAALIWLPQLRYGAHRLPLAHRTGAFRSLIHQKLAWQIALFMGMQSLGFYSILSWLPSILRAHGVSPVLAGIMLSSTMLIAIPVSLLTPAIAARRPDQRGFLLGVLALCAIGYSMILFAPRLLGWPAMLCIGAGQGAAFPLALTLIVLRSKDGITAMGVSAFAQAVGYAISIAGPLGMGAIHAATGHWQPAILFLMATLILSTWGGLGAASNRTLSL